VIDPIRNERGELIGFAKVTRDITERMQTQRVLQETREQLAASQKMEAIGQLSGSIAHDFNNLLMIVIGNLETAQRNAKSPRSPNPNLDRALGNAMRGAQRAAALTSRLLAFSRRQALDPKPLDPNRFLSSSAEFLQRAIGETVEVEVVGTAGSWQIEADPNHLETALAQDQVLTKCRENWRASQAALRANGINQKVFIAECQAVAAARAAQQALAPVRRPRKRTRTPRLLPLPQRERL
jgi:signal transduction histidine kinase